MTITLRFEPSRTFPNRESHQRPYCHLLKACPTKTVLNVGGAGGGDRDAGGADGPGQGQLPVEVFDAAGGARRVRARAGGRPQPRGVRRGVGPDGGGAVLRV